MIEVQGLTKRYGSTTALDQVSFSVRQGEVLGFLGPNGAGKTTCMRILTGFMPPDGGSARIGGHDVERASLDVRRLIGYLPESSPLYHEMLVYEYLLYIAALRAIPSRDRLGRVRAMAETCGLESVLDKEIGALSKGFRQRVGLAQALIHEPQILVLDEPTSGLDPNQIVEIRDLIKRIGRERTVLFSTHILSEVEATCDRVIIVDAGKIVGSGTPAELASRAAGGTYYLVTTRAPEALLLPKLAALDGVRTVTRLESSNGATRLRLDCVENADIGESIFQIAVAAGFTLSELRRETASLEHIFRQLTSRTH